jgi:hypothetical protein
MAFKLVCTQEFHDHHTGRLIKRGEEVYDYEHILHLHTDHPTLGSRTHHFVKVHLVMEDDQWHWPPSLKELTARKTRAAALEAASKPAPAILEEDEL